MVVISLDSNRTNTLGFIWSLGSAGHKVIHVSKPKYIANIYVMNKH